MALQKSEGKRTVKISTEMKSSDDSCVLERRRLEIQKRRQAAVQRQDSLPLIQEAEEAPPKNCKRLVVLGSAKVGKTSIVNRFLNNNFDDKYTPTIEDFHRKVYRIKGETYRLDILDTSGYQPFPAMRRLSLVTGDLFLLVYSVDAPESFDEVTRLREHILKCKSMTSQGSRQIVPIVFVANKCDLPSQVPIEDARELAQEAPGCVVVKCSARENNNINDIFIKLFDLARLPTEMSPSLHRRVTPAYVPGNAPPTGRSLRGISFRRKLSDVGTVDPSVRRPSIRTDLLIYQTQKHFLVDGDDKNYPKKCVIQ